MAIKNKAHIRLSVCIKEEKELGYFTFKIIFRPFINEILKNTKQLQWH